MPVWVFSVLVIARFDSFVVSGWLLKLLRLLVCFVCELLGFWLGFYCGNVACLLFLCL